MIFDSHAHYDDRAFDEDRERILEKLPAAGVGYVINVGSSTKTSVSSIALAHTYDYIYAAVGVHPSDVPELEDIGLDAIRHLAADEKSVAIGEIGLDYYWPEPDRDLQKKWFRAQLELARELDMPVIIHSRDAAEDTYEIMKEAGGSSIRAVIHCFSYEKEMAKRFLDLGYYIGLGGVLTYKNGRKQKEVMETLPLDRLLLETDCPYLSPDGHRGERNSSLNLPIVIDEMARIRGLDRSGIEDITCANAKRFYGL